MLVSYASQNFITKLEFKCLQSNLNIKEFSWAQLPRMQKIIKSYIVDQYLVFKCEKS